MIKVCPIRVWLRKTLRHISILYLPHNFPFFFKNFERLNALLQAIGYMGFKRLDSTLPYVQAPNEKDSKKTSKLHMR